MAQNDRLTRENVELTSRCGFLQARVQDLERENRLLRAPAAADPAPVGKTDDPVQASTSITLPIRLTGWSLAGLWRLG